MILVVPSRFRCATLTIFFRYRPQTNNSTLKRLEFHLVELVTFLEYSQYYQRHTNKQKYKVIQYNRPSFKNFIFKIYCTKYLKQLWLQQESIAHCDPIYTILSSKYYISENPNIPSMNSNRISNTSNDRQLTLILHIISTQIHDLLNQVEH